MGDLLPFSDKVISHMESPLVKAFTAEIEACRLSGDIFSLQLSICVSKSALREFLDCFTQCFVFGE